MPGIEYEIRERDSNEITAQASPVNNHFFPIMSSAMTKDKEEDNTQVLTESNGDDRKEINADDKNLDNSTPKSTDDNAKRKVNEMTSSSEDELNESHVVLSLTRRIRIVPQDC